MIKRLLTIIPLALLLGACVSGPSEQTPQSMREAKSLLSKGVEQYQAYQYQAAAQLFSQALSQYRLIDNPQGIITSSINLARVLHATGKPDRAQQWLQQADKLNRRQKPENHQKLSEHINLLRAAVDIERGKLPDAATRLEQLIGATQQPDIKLGALQLRARIAQIQQSDFSRWLQRYADSVKSQGNHKAQQARLARFQAHAASDNDEQQRLFSRALTLYRELANPPGIASTLTEWAQTELAAQRYTQAEDKLLRALRIRLTLRDALHARQALTGLQAVYRQLNRDDALQQVEYWTDKLSAEDFSQWQAAMQAFDNYPQ